MFLNNYKIVLKRISAINWLLQTNEYKRFRHWLVRRLGDRLPKCTFTRFLRLPGQYDALCGPVLEHVLKGSSEKKIRITVIACSNGAEAYSIASVLTQRRPDVEFTIFANDINEEMIVNARRGRYTNQEVRKNKLIAEEFINATFLLEGDSYVVRSDVARRVRFDVVDALTYGLRDRLGMSDIVYAQNIMINLKPVMAARMFNNICSLLKPTSALFIDGIDLDLRVKLTRAQNLVPLDYKMEEIYAQARELLDGWPCTYSGLEPISREHEDWRRRYSTVFLKS